MHMRHSRCTPMPSKAPEPTPHLQRPGRLPRLLLALTVLGVLTGCEQLVYYPQPLTAARAAAITASHPQAEPLEIRVAEGETVHAGQVLLTLESMKMESGVPAPRDGEVAKIHVVSGQAVEAGDTLVELAI